MVIKRSRINSDKYFLSQPIDSDIYIRVDNVSCFSKQLKTFGFDDNVESGACVLPCVFNKYAKKNAEMFFTVNKNLPKEEYIQTRYWTRTQWAGRGETEQVTDIVYITKLRYHRDYFSPYSVSFTYVKNGEEDYIISDKIPNTIENKKKLLNTANMVLGLFGECRIVGQNEEKIKKIRLDWDILPPGEYPWDRISSTLSRVCENKNRTTKELMLRNCEEIHKLSPDFVAYGRAGFNGYVVFGFTKKNLYVLESYLPDNATYIFDNNWEELSKLTKAQILTGDLCKARLIHSKSWNSQIKKVVGGTNNG